MPRVMRKMGQVGAVGCRVVFVMYPQEPSGLITTKSLKEPFRLELTTSVVFSLKKTVSNAVLCLFTPDVLGE